jgi:hypothetical protein
VVETFLTGIRVVIAEDDDDNRDILDPVIVVSGFAEQQVPRLAQAPFAHKLLKPIDPWRLAEVILDVVRGRAAP